MSGDRFQCMSLQEHCRTSILKAVTVERLQRISELPLPTTIKDLIATYRVPDDFNTNGYYFHYNFNFLHHPHHRTHRVHPARSTFDKSSVLLVAQVNPQELCHSCNLMGNDMRQESAKWVDADHPNVQKCFVRITKEENTGQTCHVLEYPLFSLKDIVAVLSDREIRAPEYLLWDCVLQLCSGLQYLEERNMSNEWYEASNCIITKNGSVKVENLLVYLPAKGRVCTRLCIKPRGSQRGKGMIWNLASVFYELAALVPAHATPESFLPFDSTTESSETFPKRLPAQYSDELNDILLMSFGEEQHRPTLKVFIDTASKNLMLLKAGYTGPMNLLELLPDVGQFCEQ